MGRLAGRTAHLMYVAAEQMQTTLMHKGVSFSHADLVTVASLIGGGHVGVTEDREVTSALHADAVYLSREVELINLDTGEVERSLPGNTLYLPEWPDWQKHWLSTLSHEAVHISSDIRGIPETIWSNEQLAYFVDAFVAARVDESTARRKVARYPYLLIGCLASELFEIDPYVGLIKSESFNKRIDFDFTSDGGRKGRENPYAALNRMVRRAYPHGRKKAESKFDGINSFELQKLPKSVYEAYKLGAMAWPLVLDKALQSGLRSMDRLTDIVFHLHHPERRGRPLAPDESRLISEWKNFRALIGPRVAAEGSPTL